EELAQDRAEQWRSQHEFLLFRQQRNKEEKERKPAAAAATAPASAGSAESPTAAAATAALMPLDAKRALIAAAMERARQQRDASKPQNTDNLSDVTRAEIEAIEARRKKNENS